MTAIKNKAILIDPYAATDEAQVREVEYADFREIQAFIECDTFTSAGLSNGDTAFVDDNGLLTLTEASMFFVLRSNYPYPLAGRAIVVGPADDEGVSLAPKATVQQIRDELLVLPIGLVNVG